MLILGALTQKMLAESVVISQSSMTGIVLDEYYKSLKGSYPTNVSVVRFVVNSGVDIVAPDTARGAIETGSNWADGAQIIIENHGRILGRGGDGGRSAYWHSVENNQAINADDTTFTTAQNGDDGGVAIHAPSHAVQIDNYSLIAGGGGGGGGQGLFSGNSYYNMLGGGGTGGGAPFGKASFNESTYQMYLADTLSPTNNKIPLDVAGNYLIIATNSARYYTNGGANYKEMGSQYFAATLPQERWVGLELAPNTTSNKTDFSTSNLYDLLIGADGGRTKILQGLAMATSATLDTAGKGGNGVVGLTAWQASVIQNANSQNILTNHGGDGGEYGENGHDGVLTEHFGIVQSSTSITRPSAQGGQAGLIYQGNVTINNVSGGITKGRIPA